jgi:hypothetical protein
MNEWSGTMLWSLIVCEVFIVHLYHKGYLGPDEVGSLVVDCFDHSKELKVVGVIVLFGGGERGRVVSHWVALSWGS